MELSDVPKLDWIPLYIHKAKASDTWRLPDRMWAWFWKLLINAMDSDRPGYLPNDIDKLWGLAGADSKAYFLKRREFDVLLPGGGIEHNVFARGGMSLVDRYFRATADGLWIYNPRLVQIIKEQIEKKGRKVKTKTVSFSLTDTTLLESSFLKAYQEYPRHVGKAAAEKAFFSAVTRHSPTGNLAETAEMIVEKAEKFAQTPAGKRGSYTPHMSTWLNQDRFLDDEREWFTEPTDDRPARKNRAEEIQQSNRAAIRAAFDASLGIPANGQGFGEIPEPGDHAGNGTGVRGRLGKTGHPLRTGSIREGAGGVCVEAGAEVLPDSRGTGRVVRGDAGDVSPRTKVVSITGND